MMTSKTQWILSTIYVLLAANTMSKAANILVFAPMPFKSHFGGFQPLFQELTHRGHNVTVVSAFPLKKHLENYTDIVVGIDKTFAQGLDPIKMANENFIEILLNVGNLQNSLAHATLPVNVIQNFIQYDNSKFDLVFIFSFGQTYCVTLGHKYNAPVIMLNVVMLWQVNSKWIGEPYTYSYIPDPRIRTTDKMSFMDKLKNTLVGIIQLFFTDYYNLSEHKKIMNAYFRYSGWEQRPSLEDMLHNISLTLINAHYTVGLTRPYLPGTVEIGGLHVKEPKKLSSKFLDFIESAEHGVIYFSLGTVANPAMLPKAKLQIFISVFNKLKQKIMWKWSQGKTPQVSDNVMISDWFPQPDILGHSNVKLFITHGGLHSLEEASYNAKPLIGIPFFGDQHMNMRIVEEKGFGRMIDIFTMNEESLLSTIKDVLENPMYNENSIRQSLLYRDRDMKPIDRAVYWVEYVLRHKGAKHLISQSTRLNIFQYFLIDVFIVFGFFITIVIFLVLKILNCLFKYNKSKLKTA
ncbi:UDP-glycosyltransferase UGT4-like [Daktulosphaira vitifoliae]|uniref:UDP-glycosyltransferase UGT4-like n=1 Tax=Daktulosphaira vitifoliae TaxID=58002 RepID=UPI0021AA11F3|nr:UDP-glycosyltransferase UGT4-like [Daktulosphaira vitifoliae]XP_050537200.1 UDP-glycosyltransferase UGT4-like [Daktulosphaira vitifoliae]XP_050537201.1 UDP-glycosyltransferase UGT4-like [Daktulosphaira vitifoliae]XP_050537202.1 UDP-glycosyltransferase UGT4-like [Daktulosphaira vitifoliae]XP_050537203.1 UDP-glycosyltransferase UGT4-like [Daktulosphaira vitifoliae]XP_050537204.1 UDP-glycosyltransferase UGT4-like [Daktulosphaira vitifoliae]